MANRELDVVLDALIKGLVDRDLAGTLEMEADAVGGLR